MKYLRLIYFHVAVAYQAYAVNRIFARRLVNELNTIEGMRQPLSREKVTRIKWYLLQMQILAGWVCALRGYGLSSRERTVALYLGAITPFLDDLTDQLKWTSVDWLREIKKGEDVSDDLRVVGYLYLQLHNQTANDFLQTSQALLAAQDDSLAQVGERAMTARELRTLTANKGGRATLLYRTVLGNPLVEGEAAAFTTLGYALQQINDLFDVYKDTVNQQQTLFTRPTDLAENRRELEATLELMTEQFQGLNYKPANVRKCLLLISIVTSRGLVCIDQLIRLQGNAGSFDATRFTRDQLVCDMEKFKNMAASFLYSVKFYDERKLA